MNVDGTRVQAKTVFKQNEHAVAIPPVHDENGLPLPLPLGHPGHHSGVGAAQLMTVASLVNCSVPQLVSVASSTLREVIPKKNLLRFGHCPKGGGGPTRIQIVRGTFVCLDSDIF